MIVKKYTAATETDAVLKAREELGSGAVVLNVKTVKQEGLHDCLIRILLR